MGIFMINNRYRISLWNAQYDGSITCEYAKKIIELYTLNVNYINKILKIFFKIHFCSFLFFSINFFYFSKVANKKKKGLWV
jgi:hypothetical protein